MSPSPGSPHLHRLSRRRALRWAGGAGAVGLVAACSDFANAIAPTTTTTTIIETTTTTEPPDAIPPFPDETAGRFAADGSTSRNVLTVDGIDRVDMTTSFGGLEGRADGIPTKVQLTVAGARSGTALGGAVIHLWHCDAAGRYSLYDLPGQNHLRAVQPTDNAGRVQFNTIFPGCRPDRWPHLHLQVFESARTANFGSRALKTSQLAIPESTCRVAYADPRYEASLTNFDRQSLEDDDVFGDSWEEQLAAVVGDPASGFVLSALVAV